MQYYRVERSASLSHHGILGQKWGIRRYQNKDGTLTSAGKKHYGTKSTNAEKAPSTSKSGGEQLESLGWKRDSTFDKFLEPDEVGHKSSYETTLKTKDGRKIDFAADYDDRKETPQEFIKRNKAALSTYEKNEASIKKQIGEELYDQYAEYWKGNNTDNFPSKNDFLKKLTPGTIGIGPNKNWPTQVIMEDKSGLFGGHVVTFEMDDKGKAMHIALEG